MPFGDEYQTFAQATHEAGRIALLLNEPHVVVVRVERNRPMFAVLMLLSFDDLRQRGTATDLAIVATVSPTGDVTMASPFIPKEKSHVQ